MMGSVRWRSRYVCCGVVALGLLVGCAEEEEVVGPQAVPAKKAPTSVVQPKEDGGEEPLVEAGPEIILPRYSYPGAAGRDPFVPFFSKKPIIPDASGGEGRKALSDRPREPLEQFDLSTLRLVAVIGRQGRRMALIRDVSGKSYEVLAGQHIGLNEGKIVRIDPDKLIILEPYVDQFGQQQERLITKNIK